MKDWNSENDILKVKDDKEKIEEKNKVREKKPRESLFNKNLLKSSKKLS